MVFDASSEDVLRRFQIFLTHGLSRGYCSVFIKERRDHHEMEAMDSRGYFSNLIRCLKRPICLAFVWQNRYTFFIPKPRNSQHPLIMLNVFRKTSGDVRSMKRITKQRITVMALRMTTPRPSLRKFPPRNENLLNPLPKRNMI